MATRKTPEQRIEELRQKRDQITAQISKQSALARQKERKRDTRRKIIAGALALEHAEIDQAFGQKLKALLREHVTRPEDRTLFDL